MKNYEKLTRQQVIDCIANSSWDRIGDILEELTNESDTNWYEMCDGCHPRNGDKVIIGYKDDTADHPIYDSDVATYYYINGQYVWVVDNDLLPYDVEVWQPIPRYDGRTK